MIETLLADELRDQAAEAYVLAQFKTPPAPAIERIERELAKVARASGSRTGISIERARQMAADAATFDAALAAGKIEDV